MKAMKIVIPDTTIEIADQVCPTCRRPVEGMKKNRLLTNLQGILDNKSKDITLRESYEMADIFREVAKSLNLGLDLTLPLDSFNKVKKIIEGTNGWGNMESQIEMVEAFEKATEIDIPSSSRGKEK